ncbi:MAG: Cof-type HAD-IIB family hydrolase [Lactovum sp.]
MSTIKLIALDLDGTLLNGEKRISDENLRSLYKARKKGIHIVFNTGRPLISCLEYFSTLNLYGAENYSITYNGGLIQRNDGKIISKSLLTYEEIQKIVEKVRQFDFPCEIISNDISYTLESTKPSLLTYVNNTLDFQKISFDELPMDVDFNKVIIARECEELDEFYSQLSLAFRERFEIVKTRDILLEIMPKNINKGIALAELCRHLNISQNRVLAMGDEDNDAEMLAWAGLGIAPSNAKGKAAESADEILPVSHEEDAVAYALKKYVL